MALLVAFALGLGGCSWVPQWANPVGWYDAAFSDDAPPPPEQAGPPPGSDQAFPTLSSVPERPEGTATAEEQQAVAKGLVADREQARYTDEVLRGTPTAPPPPRAPAPAPEAAAPAEQAAPLFPTVAESAVSAAPVPPPPTPYGAAPTIGGPPPEQAPPPFPTVLQPIIVARAEPAPPPEPTPVAEPSRLAAAPAPTISQPSIVARSAPPPPLAPYPPLSPGATVAAPVAAPAPAPMAMAQVMPQPMATRPLMPGESAAPAAPGAVLSPGVYPAVSAGQQTLVQAFAANLAASASTVVTTPTHAGFGTTTAQPLPPQAVPVPEVIRNNYNESLALSAASIPPASAAMMPSRPLPALPQGSAVASVKFAHGSAALSAAARKTITRLAAAYKERGGTVRVVGHASQQTKDLPILKHNLVNFRLSADRAQAVAKHLIDHGVPPEAIVLEARGAGDPLYYEWMPEGEAQNRRADIYFES